MAQSRITVFYLSAAFLCPAPTYFFSEPTKHGVALTTFLSSFFCSKEEGTC